MSIHLRKSAGGIVTGKLTKNRNGSCDIDLAFRIHTAEIGIDADGDPVTTAVCVPCKSLEDDRKSLKPTERAALDSILEMMEGNSEVDEHDWRQAAQKDARITTAEKPDSRRRVVSSALKGLAQKEEIAVKDGVISIPQAVEDDQWPNDDGEEDHVG